MDFKSKWLLVIALVALVVLISATQRGARRNSTTPLPTRRTPRTEREQAMYFRLREAFPEHIVLAQVAFSAFMDTKKQAARNRFDRKVADFLLCTRAFEVIAVIELDDASHRGKEAVDDRRDRLLKAVGYRAVRFANVPTVAVARRSVDISTAAAK